jgi:hypothetical protein
VFAVRLCLPGIPHLNHNPLQRWSLMIAPPRPLMEVFAAIPDLRKPRGQRHPLTAIFALACCAMLYGARSYSAMGSWGRHYGTRITQALGFTHATPCAATLHTIFRHVDRDACETPNGQNIRIHLFARDYGQLCMQRACDWHARFLYNLH